MLSREDSIFCRKSREMRNGGKFMDKNLYNTMQELVKQENVISADAKYLGAITIEKDSPTSGKIKIGKEITIIKVF